MLEQLKQGGSEQATRMEFGGGDGQAAQSKHPIFR